MKTWTCDNCNTTVKEDLVKYGRTWWRLEQLGVAIQVIGGEPTTYDLCSPSCLRDLIRARKQLAE